MSALHILILAGGKSSRFKTSGSKVLHPICGRPAIHYLLHSTSPLNPTTTVIVVSPTHQHEFKTTCAIDNCSIAIQPEPRGSGDAVRAGLTQLPDAGRVLICYGDMPLLSTATLRVMHDTANQSTGAGSLLSVVLPGMPYGRVIRNDQDLAVRVVEERDCTPDEKLIQDLNAGVYCVDIAWLRTAIPRLHSHNAQGEYYLTDIVELAHKDGCPLTVVDSKNTIELTGMNTRADAAFIASAKRRDINERHMAAGIDIVHPECTYIDDTVTIGSGTRVQPGTHFLGKTAIGNHCDIGPGAILESCHVADHTTIKPYAVLQNTKI